MACSIRLFKQLRLGFDWAGCSASVFEYRPGSNTVSSLNGSKRRVSLTSPVYTCGDLCRPALPSPLKAPPFSGLASKACPSMERFA